MRRAAAQLTLFIWSGIAASVFAGIVGALLIGLFMNGLPGLLLAFALAWIGAALAVVWTVIPATIVGGCLWNLGDRRPRLREKWLWAAVGAAIGTAALLYPGPSGVKGALANDDAGFQGNWMPLVFVLAGIAGGLAFRSVMRFGEAFVPDDLDA